ncbi:MAG: MATE family efflux transporter, partial [Myxococcota bacterium]|nr:MATE family efflux transporter [Myxococcota bacterium]
MNSAYVAPVQRDRIWTILGLGLPIIGGMISQNVLNLVDTAMVGTLGDAALAGVGVGAFANFMGQALVMGLGAGVQAVVARRMGEGREADTVAALDAGLLLAVLFALPLSLTLIWWAPVFFPLLNGDAAVIGVGVPYLQARLCGMVGVGLNFAFRGYWNGISLSVIYLRTLVLMHTCNIFLNYVLIFGALGFPELGATGAGVGTAIATYLGSAYYVLLATRHARKRSLRHQRPVRRLLTSVLRLSVPNGIQMFFFASGLTVLFWIIGRVGTTEVAAANVLINVMLVAILPAVGLGLAAASLVGQALGRGDVDDAVRWGWDVVKVAVVFLTLLGLPMWLAPTSVLAVFIHNPDTLALAVIPLQLVGLLIAVDGIGGGGPRVAEGVAGLDRRRVVAVERH